MESPFELFPRGPAKHSDRWNAAHKIDPSLCPGKDTTDTKCTCPDVMYATKVRVFTGETIEYSLSCGCCDLPITST